MLLSSIPLIFSRKKIKKYIKEANSCRDTGKWAYAAILYEKALDLNGNLPHIWVQYGHALKESGHIRKAIDAYAHAAQLSENYDTYVQLGHALKILGLKSRAAQAYANAVTVKSKSLDAERELAILGYDLRRLPKEPQHIADEEFLKDIRQKDKLQIFGEDFLNLKDLGHYTSIRDAAYKNYLSDDFLNFFDHKFYFQKNEFHGTYNRDIKNLCVLHFILIGVNKMAPINPYMSFDCEFYEKTYEHSFRMSSEDRYRYWLNSGIESHQKPNSQAYDSQNMMLGEEGNISLLRDNLDVDFYARQIPDSDPPPLNLVLHYHMIGWMQGLDPSPLFSTHFYLENNPDIRDGTTDPFLHYLKFGKPEGRRGQPNERTRRYYEPPAREVRSAIENYFDREFYIQEVPSLAVNDADPILHYIAVGASENLDPSPDFSTKFYRDSYPSDGLVGKNPLFDYIKTGFSKGAIPAPIHPVLLAETQEQRIQITKDILRDFFDAEYYNEISPDLKRADTDLLEHYIVFGWRENRDPAPWFSVSFYLSLYPRTKDYGVDPLTHYLIWGKENGFRCHVQDQSWKPASGLHSDSAINDKMLMSALAKTPEAASPTLEYTAEKLNIHWIIPNFGIGSGGHMTIFRTIHWLEYFGHTCTIWIKSESPVNPDESYEKILKYYQFVKAEIRELSNILMATCGDALVATSWDTAFIADKAKSFKERFYFIQDYEPYFYPRGSRSVVAESTYRLDLACICASPWLSHIMQTQYSRWARFFYLSYDRDFYYPATELDRKNAVPRIALYSRIDTERRCVELAILALEELARQGFSFTVEIFGTGQEIGNLQFPSRFHAVLASDALGELYRQCDIGICFSSTNYSLVPQEMMGCGLPVIELDVESVRHSIADDAAFFVPPLPSEITRSVKYLLENPQQRLALAKRGQEWVENYSWEKAARTVEAALKEKLENGAWTQCQLPTPHISHLSQEVKASIIIPTLNGGPIFETVLQKIAEQKVCWPIELIVIDSGSSDDTINLSRNLPFSRVIEVPKSEFQHARVKNYAASQARGEFLLYLAQDSIPADLFWVYNFVSIMDKYPEAAGSFGKCSAHKDAAFFTKIDIFNLFNRFNDSPLLVSKYTNLKAWNAKEQNFVQMAHFYSDNNSCMRRSAWKKMPYPEVAYGEDRLWAYHALQKGWGRLYCPNAVVYHSHDYDYDETFEHADVEGWFFEKYFDYDLSIKDIDDLIAHLYADIERLGARDNLSRAEIDRRKHNMLAQCQGWNTGKRRADMEKMTLPPTCPQF